MRSPRIKKTAQIFGSIPVRFGHHEAEDAGRVESRTVAHGDDNFALAQAHVHGSGDGILRRLRVCNDFQELHLVDWREVVHANHLGS